jgi:hypothetical protein
VQDRNARWLLPRKPLTSSDRINSSSKRWSARFLEGTGAFLRSSRRRLEPAPSLRSREHNQQLREGLTEIDHHIKWRKRSAQDHSGCCEPSMGPCRLVRHVSTWLSGRNERPLLLSQVSPQPDSTTLNLPRSASRKAPVLLYGTVLHNHEDVVRHYGV